jgi:hypothetical protein
MNNSSYPEKEFTNVIINEDLKQIIYKQIITAQDVNSPFYLSKLDTYEMYHDALEEYFNAFYNKKPTQTDKLAFIILLTYPKKFIENINNFNDLKLAFNNIAEESDFESKGFEIRDGFGGATCICNEPIINVHKFINKYTGAYINLGNICNKRYGLISKNDPSYKSTCLKIKEFKERKKEIEEGKPIGYYKEQRENEKIKKAQNKLEKELLQQTKLLEKIKKTEEKQRQNEEKLMSNEDNFAKNMQITCCYKNCLLCEKKGLYSKYCRFTICNKCLNNKAKIQKLSLNQSIIYNKREYKEEDCLNCDKKFIYKYTGMNKDFCNICETNYKKTKCKLCPNDFIDNINSIDLYCNDCDEKIKDCLNCKNKYIPKNEHYKYCNLCFYRVNNNLTVITCQECDEEVEIKISEKWRKFCKDCFKNNLIYFNCENCLNPFKRLTSDTWRTVCQDCYYNSK